MSAPTPTLDLSEARRKATEIHEKRLAAISAYEEQIVKAAEAEREYRKAKAVAWVKARTEDVTAAEKEAMVDAATADLRFQRDVERGLVQSKREYLSSLEGDRAMLNKFSEWSRWIDGEAA